MPLVKRLFKRVLILGEPNRNKILSKASTGNKSDGLIGTFL